MSVLAFLIGVALVVTTWASVLRTVFIPRQSSSRVMRYALWAVAGCGRILSRQLPDRVRDRVLDMCAPLSLCITLAWWLLSLGLGFLLLTPLSSDNPLDPDSVARFLLLRGDSVEGVLALAAWTSVAAVLVVFVAYLIGVFEAYNRREVVVARMTGQAVLPPGAEVLLAEYLRVDFRNRLDLTFTEWTRWLGDIHATHVSCPVLVHYRPAGRLCWLDAAVFVLDAAALAEAIAPRWTPPSGRDLLRTGSECLPRLASQLGIELRRPEVSLQGREEFGFEQTVRLAVAAGLPHDRTYAEAWATFQHWRTRYAPYAAAMSERLTHAREQESDLDLSRQFIRPG